MSRDVSKYIAWSKNSPWSNDEPGEVDIFVLVEGSSKFKKQQTGVNCFDEKRLGNLRLYLGMWLLKDLPHCKL